MIKTFSTSGTPNHQSYIVKKWPDRKNCNRWSVFRPPFSKNILKERDVYSSSLISKAMNATWAIQGIWRNSAGQICLTCVMIVATTKFSKNSRTASLQVPQTVAYRDLANSQMTTQRSPDNQILIASLFSTECGNGPQAGCTQRLTLLYREVVYG